jgi:NAD(P)-dependent dehydrogenase (short-subunit alcohol dehydrogenase family)/uncharacterized protein YndB with AHSA1/START domain
MTGAALSAELRGEVALITGASRGIGLATAKLFARAGATVGLVARSATDLAAAEHVIASGGGTVASFAADVTSEAEMSRAVDHITARLGPISILVNNAGAIGPLAPFAESSHADWWKCVEVNLRGPAICTHLVIHQMAARGQGRIINLVSGAGISSFTYFSAYVAAKTALVRWTETVAAEYQPYGVLVFAMEPGTVATDMSAYSVTSPDGKRWIPWFKGLFDLGLTVPMERVTQRALDLAAGKADGLTGRYIPLADTLDALVADIERIRGEALYSLRIGRLHSAPLSDAIRKLRVEGEQATTNVIRLRRRLPITPRQALDLWRDGSTIARWFPPPGVTWIEPPSMELRPGGRLNLHLAVSGERFHAQATVRSVDPAALVLEWSWTTDSATVGSGVASTVRVDFQSVGNAVDVVITHEATFTESMRDAHIRGWRRCLDGMDRLSMGN